MTKSVLVLAFACATAWPALLSAEPVESPAPTEVSDFSPPKVTCRRETVTGSRLPKKVCTTQAQRDQQREADREALEKVQRGTPPIR